MTLATPGRPTTSWSDPDVAPMPEHGFHVSSLQSRRTMCSGLVVLTDVLRGSSLMQLCCDSSERDAFALHVRLPGRSGELGLAEAHQSCVGCQHLHREGQSGG